MFCRDGLEDDFWWINWDVITIMSALNGGLSVINKQHYKFSLHVRSSEGIYKSIEHRKHNKAAFRH